MRVLSAQGISNIGKRTKRKHYVCGDVSFILFVDKINSKIQHGLLLVSRISLSTKGPTAFAEHSW